MTRFCIILGAMKAGTTSLFNYLTQHPEIAPCKTKETSFFTHYYKKGFKWYQSLWKDQDINNKILLEASTNYTKYPSFAEGSQNIFDFSRRKDVSLKFIYIMRNPIERIESQFNYAFARWTNRTLNERIKPNGHLVNVSRYAQQLDQYTDKFDLKDILLLDFDDLINDPERILKEICLFLGIDERFQFSKLHKIHNPSEGATIVRPIENAYKKLPFLKNISNLFPKKFKIWILNFLPKLKIKYSLTEQQQKKVHDALKDDMARLHDKYRIDVSKWGF